MILNLECGVLRVCAKFRAHVFGRTAYITQLQAGNFGTIFQHSNSSIRDTVELCRALSLLTQQISGWLP